MTRAASAPPEARGLRRDGVRLLVVEPERSREVTFADLGAALRPGDLLVVNTSATLPAAVDGRRGGAPVTVHFSTRLAPDRWLVEIRPPGPADGPVDDAAAGQRVDLPGGAWLTLSAADPPGGTRLWRAQVAVEGAVSEGGVANGGVEAFLARHGRPISYRYVPGRWPLADYQTVFARDAGSAEMPSAGRPFTGELVARLVAAGVALAPITLHTGVSSSEAGEPPLPEPFRVPAGTAALVEHTHRAGGRVIAVGTTVTRALESLADTTGTTRPGQGWTDLVLGPDRPARVVDGLITGWHPPGASHRQLLVAVAGADLVDRAYAEADRADYLGHEFGDSCLLLPDSRGRAAA